MYLIEKIKTELLLSLKTALGKEYQPTLEDLVEPKDPAWGDVSFPCFKLAQGLKRNPAEISRELAAKVAIRGYIKEVKAEGPYINFILDHDQVFLALHKQIQVLDSKYGTFAPERRRVMLEYSGLNTHKPLHIGHLRNLVLGAALARLLRAEGVNLVVADFVNDLGLHVAEWLWAYKKFHQGEKTPKDLGKFMSLVYTEGAAAYEQDPEAKKEILAVLMRLQENDRKIMGLWKKTRGWSLRDFRKIYKEIGAVFDTFYAESALVEKRMKVVEELLKKGIAKESEGATIVDLEDVGLGVLVILRSDKTALYSTTDLALATQKFKDYKLDMSAVLTDARQKQHFAQVFETLKRAGFKQEMKHIPYEFVTLPEGAMSSRKGTVVLYEDLRDEVYREALEETTKRHPDWSRKKLEKTARALAFGALKFDMLRQDPEKPITFEIKQALAFEGFSAPYLQYTTARISGILRKAGKLKKLPKKIEIKERSEEQLLILALRYPEIVRRAAEELKPSLMAHYLFVLAQTFADFYESVQVLRSVPEEKQLHLAVLSDLLVVMRNGLELLGIETLEEM
ncbi:MAG: arginine--tRNA ligase [bacterium]